MSILDYYVTSAPNAQNALDIFKGEWSSQLPGDLASLQAGPLGLFADPRIEWAIEKLGGVKEKKVLELGPLEAGHTYMLERAGASSITAIEANSRAYLKCLIVKEILRLQRAQFLCGDFAEYLRSNPEKFDACIASGVLYHMRNPAELIALLAKVTNKVFFWTHYYDHEIISRSPDFKHRFPSSIPAEYEGFKHTLHRQQYNAALGSMGFCGGTNVFSHWMSRKDIFSCLDYFGFSEIEVSFDQPDHPNGPSLAFTAIRKG